VNAQRWPRALTIAALTVLGACGVTLQMIPPRSHAGASSASLASQSDWALAGALPASSDFPADWGYSVAGLMRRGPAATAPSARPAANGTPQQDARTAYAPAACGTLPKVLDESGGGALAAYLQVDRYSQLWAQDPEPPNADATGERHEHGPNARFWIWVVPDAPAQIADYQDWVSRCGSYRISNYDYSSQSSIERTVTTAVEATGTSEAKGADAAVTVTRSFHLTDSPNPPATYHVSYYAVRGVLMECAIYMEDADAEIVKHTAAQTLQRLRSL
jgi:hypothetical protein